MNIVRSTFDMFYDVTKPVVFKMTKKDPKRAHEWFVSFCNGVHKYGLERFILDNSSNNLRPSFELSNAAGFNKNGDIPPTVLKYLGFDRVVVGTVTYDQWNGNTRPTIRRYPKTGSLVNWEGLPGVGAKGVANNLAGYGDHGVPITINLMATPRKFGDGVLRDLEKTVLATSDLNYVDRFELNVSCPNTHSADGLRDAREDNLRMLDSMLSVLETCKKGEQEIYLKVSPDSTLGDVIDTLDIVKNHRIKGIVTANTTTNHDRRYILVSPEVYGKQVGGASGNAVYDASFMTQIYYDTSIQRLGLDLRLIACGGINSLKKLEDRLRYGADGIQIYTPLIFSGPKFLRELRAYKG